MHVRPLPRMTFVSPSSRRLPCSAPRRQSRKAAATAASPAPKDRCARRACARRPLLSSKTCRNDPPGNARAAATSIFPLYSAINCSQRTCRALALALISFGSKSVSSRMSFSLTGKLEPTMYPSFFRSSVTFFKPQFEAGDFVVLHVGEQPVVGVASVVALFHDAGKVINRFGILRRLARPHKLRNPRRVIARKVADRRLRNCDSVRVDDEVVRAVDDPRQAHPSACGCLSREQYRK